MIILQLLRIYLMLIVCRVILSWMKPDPTSPLIRVLNWVTEPALSPFRRLIPPIGGRFDLSPLFAMLIGGWLLSILRF
ncbi:MAG: YggT family protein [Candidatus Latescibacteria bacterium]|jgi:YggT family protein|nr:YggT family protein [Candidatus Latescibacterota bacterium]